MNADRIEILSEQIRQYVFHLLDAEPDIDGISAGNIAAELEYEFYRSILRWNNRASVREVVSLMATRDGWPEPNDDD